jgi:hypothetical protein
MKKKPLTGQYKYNLDTGQVYVVGSKATETPNLERQASLLKWGEERAKLERWQHNSKERERLKGKGYVLSVYSSGFPGATCRYSYLVAP